MAIGDFPATDAERLCFRAVCGADPVHCFPFGGEPCECQQRTPPASARHKFLVPECLWLCRADAPTETLPTSQSQGHAEKYASFWSAAEMNSLSCSFCPSHLFPTRLDNATVWSACSYKKKLTGRLCNPNMGCRCVHLHKAMRWEQPDNCSIRRGLRYRDLLSSLPPAWPLANCFSSTWLRNKDNDTHPSALLWDCLLAAEQKVR